MDSEDKIDKGPIFGARHVQTLLVFLNRVIKFLLQTHVTLTMVAITSADKSNPAYEEYKWSESHKACILSSLYLGELITMIPGACWIRRFGVKISLLITTFGIGALNALVPFCITWGDWQMFCLLRFIQRLLMALTNPAHMQHLTNWSPPAERNLFSGIQSMALQCSLVATLLLSGGLSKSAFGWPSVFYTTSILSLIWCVLWLILGANNIYNCKYITTKERDYIETSLKNSLEFEKEKLPIPWRAIFTSIPFWAIVAAITADSGCFFTIQAEFPAYMSGVFKVNIVENAIYSALPFVSSFLMTFVFMLIADRIQKKQPISLTTLRKGFNSVSMWIPAFGIIFISFLDEEDKTTVIVAMTLTMSTNAAIMFGAFLMCIEIAPNHTEVITAIGDFFAKISALLGPILAGVIVNDETNRFQWQILFVVLAAFYILGDLIFLVWGTCKEQPWNAIDYLEKKNNNKVEN